MFLDLPVRSLGELRPCRACQTDTFTTWATPAARTASITVFCRRIIDCSPSTGSAPEPLKNSRSTPLSAPATEPGSSKSPTTKPQPSALPLLSSRTSAVNGAASWRSRRTRDLPMEPVAPVTKIMRVPSADAVGP